MYMKAFFKRISSIRNGEKGRRAFILANGPSVLEEDLTNLAGEIVIGMNASTILDKKFGFKSKYYVLSDSRFINNNEKRKWGTSELDSDTIRIVRSDLRQYDDPDLEKNTYYVRALSRDGFSSNLDYGFYYGCTTTMLSLQLSYYLGFKDIYLLGCDLRYSEESPRFYKEEKPQLEDSFTSVQIDNIVKSSIFMGNNGVSLYSCSANSFLRPYLSYKNFSDIFSS